MLTLRKAAKQAFDDYKATHGQDAAIPKLKELNQEYAKILSRKKKSYGEYRQLKSEMQDYLMSQKIVEVMLGEDKKREIALQQENEQREAQGQDQKNRQR